MQEHQAKAIKAGEGRIGRLGGMGVRWMVGGDDSGGGFALVEHPLKPRALGAPLHRHSREDEYSYVLEGRIGAMLGDEVIFGEPGDLIFKPRDQWHTFWNAGDTDARLLEIIAPAGFERYFEELADLFLPGRPAPEVLAEVRARYGLETDPASIARLVAEHGLVFE
ncbi:MAG TPA: cupin domain-containing protein [Methylomirabilota bacterium]|jgi:quercetin dioxygenase-like cupin family protein|nr:cupin domain-containing protein [Methylomirabilota bacterium]